MMVLAMVIIGGYMMFRYKMYVALMLCMEKVSMWTLSGEQWGVYSYVHRIIDKAQSRGFFHANASVGDAPFSWAIIEN